MAEFNHSASSYASSKKKGQGFTRKCASLFKEQRARICIIRRCATMLCCWYIQGEDY